MGVEKRNAIFTVFHNLLYSALQRHLQRLGVDHDAFIIRSYA